MAACLALCLKLRIIILCEISARMDARPVGSFQRLPNPGRQQAMQT
jgi:hypothetical protein